MYSQPIKHTSAIYGHLMHVRSGHIFCFLKPAGKEIIIKIMIGLT